MSTGLFFKFLSSINTSAIQSCWQIETHKQYRHSFAGDILELPYTSVLHYDLINMKFVLKAQFVLDSYTNNGNHTRSSTIMFSLRYMLRL